MKYDWKIQNPKKRYIDDITDEEASHIARLAMGIGTDVSLEFEYVGKEVTINGNNIPHVKIRAKYYEPLIGETLDQVVGIFSNLNIYTGECFHSAYCQKEIFDYFKQQGYE